MIKYFFISLMILTALAGCWRPWSPAGTGIQCIMGKILFSPENGQNHHWNRPVKHQRAIRSFMIIRYGSSIT